MPFIPLLTLSKPRPRVTRSGTRTYMPATYTQWRSALQSHLRHYIATTRNPDMPYTQPVALTLHLTLRPKPGHPQDIDNLAGGFLDAANGILFSDDSLVHELHVYLARRAPEDTTTWEITPL